MNKENLILEKLYTEPISKEDLAVLFDLNNTRSIENYITDLNQFIQEETISLNNLSTLIDIDGKEIIYDRALKKYRFNTLLPTFIPYKTLLSYLGENISNAILNDDFKSLNEFLNKQNSLNDLTLIKSSALSSLLQKIIQIKLALKLNYSIKIEYKKFNQTATKYINPHSLIISEGIHYLYTTYHEDNISDIGESRNFSLSGIVSISVHKKSLEKLFQNIKGNAWGTYNEEKFVLLRLKNKAAIFYKREGLLQSNALSFVNEEPDGSIQIKMYYSNEQEIINFIQKWMPYATISKDTELKEKIYNQIKQNYINLTL